jgi:transaldolase
VLFLDSSDPKEIKDLYAWGVLSGVTTNPLIMSREAPNTDLETRIREVIAASTGHVSVELTSESEPEMLDEALRYHAWAPERICVKVPLSEPGIRVLSALAKRSIATNATCMMSFNQLYLTALAGATYVSLFAGRVGDMGHDSRPIVRELRRVLDREGLQSKILVGSIRQMIDVNEALEDGAHVVTVPPPLLRKMLHHPRTDSTIREFNDAWKNRGK